MSRSKDHLQNICKSKGETIICEHAVGSIPASLGHSFFGLKHSFYSIDCERWDYQEKVLQMWVVITPQLLYSTWQILVNISGEGLRASTDLQEYNDSWCRKTSYVKHEELQQLLLAFIKKQRKMSLCKCDQPCVSGGFLSHRVLLCYKILAVDVLRVV